MERKKRQEPEEMKDIQGGTIRGGTQGQSGEHDHRRVRSLSVEVPGSEAMLSDPGEPHKDIEPHGSSRPEQKVKGSGQQQERPGFEHPLLGESAASMQNEKEERARRKREHERSGKKKPAA